VNIITAVEEYLTSYVTFSNPNHGFVGALWAAATHAWPHFDVFPYMVVTSDTKQSGKTLFGIDLMKNLSANAVSAGGMTPAVCFRTIDQEKPTLLVDEAETLNSEAATDLRAALNMGYKKGATFRRVEGRKPVEYKVFCPKLFVLIGDVYDTLHDRSIIVRMMRAKPAKRFVRAVAELDGFALRDALSKQVAGEVGRITDLYAAHKGLDFLSSRDEEIWLPLFVTCEALAPELLPRLLKVAVDMAAEKSTIPRRSFVTLLDEEKRVIDHEYGIRLLRDLCAVINGRKYATTAEALAALRDLPTAPWRAFRGKGLSDIDMGNMLDVFGVHPRSIKVAKNKVQRGYRKDDVEAALARVAS
jgi:uncharacterized protein DUF3631